MSATELMPAGPHAATAVLRDLADAPDPVRYAVGAELLYALRILPRPTSTDDRDEWLCPNHPFGHDWTERPWPNVHRIHCRWCGVPNGGDA